MILECFEDLEAGPLCYSLITSEFPVSINLQNKVQECLIKQSKSLEQKDYRLLIHIISKVCLKNFGSQKFQK